MFKKHKEDFWKQSEGRKIMAFTISTKNKEQTFNDKVLVNLCSKEGFDFKLDLDFDCMLAVEYNQETNKCTIINQFNNERFLFKGKTLPARLEVDKVCKIIIDGTDDYIVIKTIGSAANTKLAEENLTESDLKDIYGEDVNVNARLKLEKRQSELEQVRIAITKNIDVEINDLKHKLSMNSKTGIVLHLALLLMSLISSFGVSNYLTGLPLSESQNVIQMPTNLKLMIVYMLIIYGIGLTLKQGVFLFLQNKSGYDSVTSKIGEKFMAVLSIIFFASIYLINVLYYINADSMQVFAVLISLFFVGTCATLSFACGYFKHNNLELSERLNSIEYSEDFEAVTKEYQQWIVRYANNLSKTKLNKIQNKMFMLQLKSAGEVLLGILTAPVLAYGVSNTLAMCFPEAAGWIRISGMRFSPVFLILASVMIIFAFFAFVKAFTCNKKIQASNILRKDGFSNFMQHGVEFLGLEGTNKLNKEMRQSFMIGASIIFIEFTMNVSYFMQEMGEDLSGMVKSCLAALVPTAILIAETYMLSTTSFETYTCDELTNKIDKD